MENQETERKIEFIIEQQAQFASDMIELEKSQKQTSGLLRQTVEIVRDGFTILSEGQKELQEGQKELQKEFRLELKHVNDKIDVLVDAQMRTDEQLKQTDELLKRNTKEIAKTDKLVRRTVKAVSNLMRTANRKLKPNQA